MKTLITLCLLIASANAMSLTDSLREQLRAVLNDELAKRSNVISLSDYLVDNEAAPFKSKRDEIDCSAICPKIHLELNAECASNKWAPNYSAVGPEGACECLTEYKCCDAKCTAVDKRSCWGVDSSKKGFLYGVFEVDCCGCNAVKCVDCEPVETKVEKCPSGGGARPIECYDYTKNDHFAESADKCYKSECVEKASDAPTDETCDNRCEQEKTLMSTCQFPYKVCEGNRKRSDCPRIEQDFGVAALDWPLTCFKDPVLIDDDNGGHFYHEESDSCRKCKKWRYDKKSCDAKNAAAAAEDCHQYNAKEMDKFCMKKDISQDNCGCDVADCVEREVTEEDEFDPSHVCPKDHIRMHGVSICMKKRDICKKCPPVVQILDADCPKGTVTQSKDCNGCPTIVCERPRVPADECSCLKYKLTEGMVLECDCPE